jgi:hypothetical protein
VHTIAINDLAVARLDLPQVEDDLPTSKQDNDAQCLQDTDQEKHESIRIHKERKTMVTTTKLGEFHTPKISRHGT